MTCTRCEGSGVFLSPLGSTISAEVCKCMAQCTLCRGVRFVLSKDQSRREYAQPCECVQRRHRVRLYTAARVPSKYYTARLVEAQRDQRNFDAFMTFSLLAKDYQRKKRGLLVMGPPGTGKTHLAAAFVHELIFQHSVPVMFQDFSELLKRLRSGYARNEPEETLIDPLTSVDVLVVDELGKGRNSEWEVNILDIIISHRYNNEKTTVFTTNYTDHPQTTLGERMRSRDRPDEERELRETLQDRVGRRIYSRLKDMCDFILLNGEDRRLEEDVG